MKKLFMILPLVLLLSLTFGCQKGEKSVEDASKTYPRSEGIITIEGISHAYVREGSGKPIVVIGSAIYYPKAFSSTLKEQFELVFIDLKHFIPSYNPPKEELEKVATIHIPNILDSSILNLSPG